MIVACQSVGILRGIRFDNQVSTGWKTSLYTAGKRACVSVCRKHEERMGVERCERTGERLHMGMCSQFDTIDGIFGAIEMCKWLWVVGFVVAAFAQNELQLQAQISILRSYSYCLAVNIAVVVAWYYPLKAHRVCVTWHRSLLTSCAPLCNSNHEIITIQFTGRASVHFVRI